MSAQHVIRETPTSRDTSTLRRDIPELTWRDRVDVVTRFVNWVQRWKAGV